MYLKTFWVFLVVSCLSTAAQATPTLSAGNWWIFPGPSQSTDLPTSLPIAIPVSGGDPIGGVDLALNTGVGGPKLQAVDLVGPGTIFNPNNTGQIDYLPFGGTDQFSLTSTMSGTVPANGVLAFLTFDATGVSIGVYPFTLTNFIGSSDLPPFSTPILVNGSITVEPEPGSIVLALFAVAAVCVVALRRRRR